MFHEFCISPLGILNKPKNTEFWVTVYSAYKIVFKIIPNHLSKEVLQLLKPVTIIIIEHLY